VNNENEISSEISHEHQLKLKRNIKVK